MFHTSEILYANFDNGSASRANGRLEVPLMPELLNNSRKLLNSAMDGEYHDGA
jgi:hypothetical protein